MDTGLPIPENTRLVLALYRLSCILISLLALVSNPSSDGGTINYSLVETLKHNLI